MTPEELEPRPVYRPWGGERLRRFCRAARPLEERIGELYVHDGARPPRVLIKWIDAAEVLSVQNHPSKQGGSKNEAWYFVEPPREGRIITGMTCPLDTPDPREFLTYTEVGAGDLVEVPAGCPHALTPGSLVLEIQEPLDVTYRIYDWGRGRELHIPEAMEARTEIPVTRHGAIRAGVVVRRPEFMIEILDGLRTFRADRPGIMSFVSGQRLGANFRFDPGAELEIRDGEKCLWIREGD